MANDEHCRSVFCCQVFDPHHIKRRLDEFIAKHIPHCIWALPQDFPPSLRDHADLLIFEDCLEIGASIVILAARRGRDDDGQAQEEIRTYIIPTCVSRSGAKGQQTATDLSVDADIALVDGQALRTWLLVFALDLDKEELLEYDNSSLCGQQCFRYLFKLHSNEKLQVLNREFLGNDPPTLKTEIGNSSLRPRAPSLPQRKDDKSPQALIPMDLDTNSLQTSFEAHGYESPDFRIYQRGHRMYDCALGIIKQHDPQLFGRRPEETWKDRGNGEVVTDIDDVAVKLVHECESRLQAENTIKRLLNGRLGDADFLENVDSISAALRDAELTRGLALLVAKKEIDRQLMPPPPIPKPKFRKVKSFLEFASLYGWAPSEAAGIQPSSEEAKSYGSNGLTASTQCEEPPPTPRPRYASLTLPSPGKIIAKRQNSDDVNLRTKKPRTLTALRPLPRPISRTNESGKDRTRVATQREPFKPGGDSVMSGMDRVHNLDNFDEDPDGVVRARMEDADEEEHLLNEAFGADDNAATGWMLEAYGSSAASGLPPFKTPHSRSPSSTGLKGGSPSSHSPNSDVHKFYTSSSPGQRKKILARDSGIFGHGRLAFGTGVHQEQHGEESAIQDVQSRLAKMETPTRRLLLNKEYESDSTCSDLTCSDSDSTGSSDDSLESSPSKPPRQPRMPSRMEPPAEFTADETTMKSVTLQPTVQNGAH